MFPITVLDGGMGKELRRIGAPFRQPEWSALALMEAPEFVVRAHTNFIEAGAQVIITNNYAVVPYHIGDALMAARGTELIALAGQLARQAADAAPSSAAFSADPRRPSVVVAGSLPPVFGSYEPERFDAEGAPALYDQIVTALAPYVDLWIAETLSRVDELDAAANALRRHGGGQRLWASFAVPDDGEPGVLRSGDTVADIVDRVEVHLDLIDAVLFNCSQPERIGPALLALQAELSRRELNLRTGGYANAFDAGARVDVPDMPEVTAAANVTISERRVDLTAERYADVVSEWIEGGATIVGGCCDMYPEHIAALAERFG